MFEVIQEQRNAIVLFDEIDHLLLDRNSRLYHELDTLFQFLTPGMLTKLQDLRSAREVLFIIATNYEHRIDAAIKRSGRIDVAQLVLPPDLVARRKIIADLHKKIFGTHPATELEEGCARKSKFLPDWQIPKLLKDRPSSEWEGILLREPRACELKSYESILPYFERDSDAVVGRYTLRELIAVTAIDAETIDRDPSSLSAWASNAPPKLRKVFRNSTDALEQEIAGFSGADKPFLEQALMKLTEPS